MDWNWFFSALAQSAAAIAGIFAAFVITKIVGNQADYRRKKARIGELLVHAQRLRDAASRLNFVWYNWVKDREAMERVVSMISEDGNNPRSPERYYSDAGFSPFTEVRVALSRIKEAIEQGPREEEPASRHRRWVFRSDPLDAASFRSATMKQSRAEEERRLKEDLSAEREKIFRLFDEFKHQARTVEVFMGELSGNSESSTLITGAIVGVLLLFFIGVIYPLSFLPIPQDMGIRLELRAFWPQLFSLKGLLLFAISLVFTCIMAVFMRVNQRMVYSQEELTKLAALTDPGAYSDYYKHFLRSSLSMVVWSSDHAKKAADEPAEATDGEDDAATGEDPSGGVEPGNSDDQRPGGK